jgi:GNAT superfamily N-acetyltransferase
VNVRFVSFAEAPQLADETGPMDESWPAFMLHDPVAAACWDDFHERHPAFQFFAVEAETGAVIGKANAVPTALDPTRLPARGWDEAIERSLGDERPTVVSALQINVHPERRGSGLSARMLAEMRRVAADHGFADLVAPVRPSLKERYPLTPIERYADWVRADGLPFDPWVRVHARAGGAIVSVCPQAMTIPGSVGEWEAWTGIVFPDSGTYVVPGALVPIEVDVEDDRGLYVEPGIWVRHRLA